MIGTTKRTCSTSYCMCNIKGTCVHRICPQENKDYKSPSVVADEIELMMKSPRKKSNVKTTRRYSRGKNEVEIPGYPGYTIDEDLIVRSYTAGKKKAYELAERERDGTTYYKLSYTDDEGCRKRRDEPLRKLHMCTILNLNPRKYTLKKIEILFNQKRRLK